MRPYRCCGLGHRPRALVEISSSLQVVHSRYHYRGNLLSLLLLFSIAVIELFCRHCRTTGGKIIIIQTTKIAICRLVSRTHSPPTNWIGFRGYSRPAFHLVVFPRSGRVTLLIRTRIRNDVDANPGPDHVCCATVVIIASVASFARRRLLPISLSLSARVRHSCYLWSAFGKQYISRIVLTRLVFRRRFIPSAVWRNRVSTTFFSTFLSSRVRLYVYCHQ